MIWLQKSGQVDKRTSGQAEICILPFAFYILNLLFQANIPILTMHHNLTYR